MQETEYTEFGQIISETLAEDWEPVLFGYAGGLQDRDTGLVRFGARDYDPETARWTSKEPLGFNGSNNFYIYAENDPVNFVDITGLAPYECFKTMDALITDIENYLINEAPMEMRQKAKFYEFLAEIIDGKSADGGVCYYYEEPYTDKPPSKGKVVMPGAYPVLNKKGQLVDIIPPARNIYGIWHSHIFYPNWYIGSEEMSLYDKLLGSKYTGGIYMSYFMTDPETDVTWVSSTKHYSQ